MAAHPFSPIPILRVEGLALLAVAVYAFTQSGASWWWFGIFLLVPDISMAGYLRNPAVGATLYNLGHSIPGPFMLFAWAWWGGPDIAFTAASIWLAHIGMDRLFGYGLKYRDDFKHTHLGTIGRGR